MVDWKNRIVETAEMAVKDLKANPKNWRKHPQAQQNALTGVLDTVGWVQQVIWNRQTGHLVDGHLRVELAAKRKEKTIPVNVVDLSPEEEAMILATFDPIAAMAEADRQMMAGLLQSIETENEQVKALLESIARDEKIDLGGEPAEAPEPQVDRAAELQEQWQTARGQLWQCGDHRVLCGDSTNAEDVARLLGGAVPFIMVTDPPYGVEYDPHWRDEIVGEFGQRAARGNGVANDDRVDWTPAYDLFPGDVAYVWHAGRFCGEVALSMVASRFDIRTQIIWMKQHFAISRGNYHWQHEPCWYGVRKGHSSKWCGDRTQSTIWEIASLNPAGRQEERVAHGTQKPVECMARPIRNHGGAGDDVYDPFLGSGTTLIACEQLGRRCFGMEISPAYTAVILERWHDTTGRDPVLLET